VWVPMALSDLERRVIAKCPIFSGGSPSLRSHGLTQNDQIWLGNTWWRDMILGVSDRNRRGGLMASPTLFGPISTPIQFDRERPNLIRSHNVRDGVFLPV